ncbi:MAG: FAD-dependent oxidoreductase [Thermodesulfobacteriota bacterium]
MACMIIGGGVAGFQAAAACRTAWPDRAVTLIDREGEAGYYRALLPQFMVGEIAEEKLFFPPRESDPLLTVLRGIRVLSLDRKERRVGLENGEALAYDGLILAHGGDPYIPDILASARCRGVFPVRDLTAARATKDWLAHHRSVLVFGGSLVAVKTAVYLRLAGFDVSIVVRRGHLLLRALSTEAALIVENHLREMGIGLHVNAPLEDVRVSGGAISGIQAGGRWIDCDTLLVAAGTSTDTSFLAGSGLLTDGALIVNPALRTSDPRIFAAGDAAVITAGGEAVNPGTWPQAASQGRRAAENLFRGNALPLTDLTRINAMELHGLAMVILGPPVEGAEVICYERPEANIRRELFLVEGKPVGGALIGDISAAGPLHTLILAGRRISGEEASLLRPRTGSVIRFQHRPVRREGMIVTPAG